MRHPLLTTTAFEHNRAETIDKMYTLCKAAATALELQLFVSSIMSFMHVNALYKTDVMNN